MFRNINFIIIMNSPTDNYPIIFLNNILIISRGNGITQQLLWCSHIEILFVMLWFISYLKRSNKVYSFRRYIENARWKLLFDF